jgi:cell division protein FtsW
MVMISSVSVYSSFNVTSLMVAAGKIKEAHNLFYLERNIMHVIIGFIMLGIVVKVPYSFFETYAKHIFIASLFFLFVVLFAGVSYNGARGWFNVPLIPFSLQPVEFAKLGLILYLAYFFKKKKALIVDFWEGLFPFLVIV